MKSAIYNELITLLKDNKVLANACENEFKPIDNILRSSWYVNEAIKLGYKNAIHINLNYGFLAIVDNDKIITGSNFMIADGLDGILTDIDDRFDGFIYNTLSENIPNGKYYEEYFEDKENSLIILSLDNLKTLFKDIDDYIEKHNCRLWEEYDEEPF